MKNMKSKGVGFCKSRSIRQYKGWCNDPVVKGGEHCRKHTCIRRGCKKEAVTYYPLLLNKPRFCSKHDNEFLKEGK